MGSPQPGPSKPRKSNIANFENSSMGKHLLAEIALGLFEFKYYNCDGVEVPAFMDLLDLPEEVQRVRNKTSFPEGEKTPHLAEELGIQELMSLDDPSDHSKLLEMQLQDALEISLYRLSESVRQERGEGYDLTCDVDGPRRFTLEKIRTKSLSNQLRDSKNNIHIDSQRHSNRIFKNLVEKLDEFKGRPESVSRIIKKEKQELMTEYTNLISLLKLVLEDSNSNDIKYNIIKTAEHARQTELNAEHMSPKRRKIFQ